MENIGALSILLAFCLAVYAIIGSVIGRLKKNLFLIVSGERAVYSVWVLLTVASALLVYALITGDFRMGYVAAHTDQTMPAIYKFTAWWGGQEGSLLLWAWLLATYSAIVVFTNRHKFRDMMPWVTAVLMTTETFFLILIAFVLSPFGILEAGRGNVVEGMGRGLNPLLQYWTMVIHPPMLYLGYVGFTVPFAFAIGSLISKQPGEAWIHTTRRWTIVTWLFQSTGILLGQGWAYAVLGWGGYWAWDPVENASLLPWLTGTAFLHSVMMQEKRGMMKVWNVWLVFITFLLCITGTFLTRSGVVASVHAFAQSSIGNWFMGFIVVILLVCLAAYFKNRDYLKSENQLDAMVSRESSFLFNNLILLVSCIAVLSGTLFPVFSEWLSGSRISVGAPFFNKVNIPIGLLLLFLTGVGPLLAWRKTSAESLQRNFAWPLAIGVVGGVVAFALGYRQFYSLVCLALCVFVTATISMEFYRGAKVIRARSGASFVASAVDLTMRNTRRYGGYIVHMGMVLIFVGFAGVAFNKDVQKDMQPGQTMQIGRYTLLLQGTDTKPQKNYTSERMNIEVLRDNKELMMLYPERRRFNIDQPSGTMVAIYSTLKEDLYVVYAGESPETQLPVIHAYLNPLVKWIWFGGAVVVLGTLVALLPNRKSVLVLSAVQQPAALPGQAMTQPFRSTPAMREGHD